MNKLTLVAAAAAVWVAWSGTPALAGTRVMVTVGDGCCWASDYPRHHYYRDHYYYDHDWRPVVVLPPPVIYEPAPTVVYRAPPSVVIVPSRGIDASAASPSYIDGNGQTCREYQTSVVVGGVSQSAYGTACRQPDGSWRVVR